MIDDGKGMTRRTIKRNKTKLTTTVHIPLDQNIHATDTVKRDLDVFVLAPIAHFGHVFAIRVVLLVALGEHDVFVQTGG